MAALFNQRFICNLIDITPSTLSRHLRKLNLKVNDNSRKKEYDIDNVRNLIRSIYTKDLLPKEQIQVFYNFKGGTGKTSVCFQISSFFSLLGFNVLIIDCDPQAHLTHSVGVDTYSDFLTLVDVIENNMDITAVIRNLHSGFDIIPSNLSMTRLEPILNLKTARELVFKKLLDPLKSKYDFIFLDTNPTISTTNRNAIIAADVVNIVCETQPYSLKGLELLEKEIIDLQEGLNQVINYRIIANKYEAKTATSQEVLGALRAGYSDAVLEAVIRKSEEFNIAAKTRTAIPFFASRKSAALEDITDLVKLLLKKSCENLKNNGVKLNAA